VVRIWRVDRHGYQAKANANAVVFAKAKALKAKK